MGGAEDDELVEALGADRAHEALGVGVEVGAHGPHAPLPEAHVGSSSASGDTECALRAR